MKGRRARFSFFTKLVVNAGHERQTMKEKYRQKFQKALDNELPRSEQERLGFEIKRYEDSGIQSFWYVKIPIHNVFFTCAVKKRFGWVLEGGNVCFAKENIPVTEWHGECFNGSLMKMIAKLKSYRLTKESLAHGLETSMWGDGFGSYLFSPDYLVNK